MKLLLAIFLPLTLFTVRAFPMDALPLGQWQYYGFFYEGNTYPPQDPSLKVSFTFYSYGHVRLFWKRDGEEHFCERIAMYLINKGNLLQKVTWVNPKNHSSCGSDPDMRLGTFSENPISWDQETMKITLWLGDKELLYLLKKIPDRF